MSLSLTYKSPFVGYQPTWSHTLILYYYKVNSGLIHIKEIHNQDFISAPECVFDGFHI